MIVTMTPDQAVLLLTTGVLLIDVELNRPGWILPGSAGLLATLLALAALIGSGINPIAAILCGSAIALLAVSVRRRTPLSVAMAATTALTLGLVSIHPQVRAVVAVPCGVVLGAGTSVLTRIARRARANKGLD